MNEGMVVDGYIIVYTEIIEYLKVHGIDNGKAAMLYCKIVDMNINNHNRKCFCTESNRYFATLLCTTERNIQRYLKMLKDKKLIKICEEKNGSYTESRRIYLQFEDNNLQFDSQQSYFEYIKKFSFRSRK